VVTFDRQSGLIEAFEPASSDVEDGVLVFPGFMDIHVHAREYRLPDQPDEAAYEKWEAACRKETFLSAGQAAIYGGVTLFCAMPNDPLPPSKPDSYNRKLQLVEDCACPVILYAAVTGDSEPWADVPYKVYLDYVSSPVNFTDWRELESTLHRYTGCRVFFHAEDPEVLKRSAEHGPRWISRPPDAEIRAVEKILELTAKLGLRTHICHVSTKKAVRLIQEHNRTSDRRVTCEVTPHHLFFSVQDGKVSCPGRAEIPLASFLEANPPLRSEDDRQFLIHALREGLVDVLASDHAPHTREDKEHGAPGMPHLDTLGALAGWLIGCGFSPVRVAEVLAVSPGRLFAEDLTLPHGWIEPGSVASFTVLDLHRSSAVRAGAIEGRGTLSTRCGWSPFEGLDLPGTVKQTVVRGKAYEF
jgi:dihydroorotase